MAQSDSPPKLIRIRKLIFDRHTGELWKNGVRNKLPEQPRQILVILIEHAGELVAREHLRKALWPADTFGDFEHGLNTAMMRLRQALGDSPEHPRYIETMLRRGYRLIAPVGEAFFPNSPHLAESVQSESDGRALPEASTNDAAPPTSFLISRTGSYASPPRIAIFAAVLVGLILSLVLFAARHAQRADAMELQVNPIQSVVVLPLENLSADKDQNYFVDGMTDELIARLATVRSLRVLSRTTTMTYKGTHKSLREIARELKVGAVVEGTVLRSGNRVRITAELIEVSAEHHLWAETYEGSIGDILALQNRVTAAIAREIRIKLTSNEEQQLATAHPVLPESYENYLKGRYYYSNNRSSEGLTKAIKYFQRATELDPRNALAYSGLANCFATIGSTLVGTMPSLEASDKARTAALKAVELDPNLAEAQVALATVRIKYDWDWAQAEKGFQRAIDLNPSYSTAYQRYSLYLMAIGRTEESIVQINRARQLDPLSVSLNFSLGWRLYMARRYDQAIEQLRNTIELDPNFAIAHVVLGQAFEQKGLYDQAIAEMKKAAAISQNTPLALAGLGHAYAVAGKTKEAEAVLARLLHPAKNEYVSPFYVALLYEGLQRPTEAISWLETAYLNRSNGLIFLKVDPELDTLRKDIRFQQLQRKMNFPT
jgi:TolB-like protein/DNA-binding winged helix-turn-helix (wHTH) protein/Tfp pilus assembly protein PilF